MKKKITEFKPMEFLKPIRRDDFETSNPQRAQTHPPIRTKTKR